MTNQLSYLINKTHIHYTISIADAMTVLPFKCLPTVEDRKQITDAISSGIAIRFVTLEQPEIFFPKPLSPILVATEPGAIPTNRTLPSYSLANNLVYSMTAVLEIP